MDIKLSTILDENRLFYIVGSGRYFVSTGREVAAAMLNVVSAAKRINDRLCNADILRFFGLRQMYDGINDEQDYGKITNASVEYSVTRINGEEVEVYNIWFT